MPSNTNPHTAGTTKPSKQPSSKITTTIGAVKAVNFAKTQPNAVGSPPNTSSPKQVPVNHVDQATVKSTDQGEAFSIDNLVDNAATGVNKKKQKRRQKQAARLAAEHPSSKSNPSQDFVNNRSFEYKRNITEFTEQSPHLNGYGQAASDYDDAEQYEPAEGEDLYYTDEDARAYHNQNDSRNSQANGRDHIHPEAGNKGKKKKKNKFPSLPQRGYPPNHHPVSVTPQAQNAPPPPPPPPPLSTAAFRSAHHISKDRIWNTSTAEERERIKEFWLSLGEEDRRSLVKVEKEAVLKKMKEQQKHSCSCTVCGRKRTAIEEELEVLYDAYYEELEQYANNQHMNLEDGAPMMPHPKMYTHPMARMPPSRNSQVMNNQSLTTGRVEEVDDGEDDEGDDEEYSDEDEDDELSEEEPEDLPAGPATDFFNFGNSLTVQGGILTVADDLLKNDGKKFIEMMEQLAERRMQREEEAQYASGGLGHASIQSHNHGPPLDEDEYDDEDDDEEYDSQEDEEYDDEVMETLTEEQRMEEGRRMFQIFAARMFEQRVLTAYREKVANERQQKLIEELEEESRLDSQREAKKAKEAQKKKDKKRQQKQVKDEERARREAEKAAEEAEARAIEDKKAEEQRLKREEQRKKREAEKKAYEEERQRKETEKQRRLQEVREQQAELERKQKEQKEREKRKREEAKKREREEREVREKEGREKKEREAKARSAQETKERNRKDEQANKVAQGPHTTSPLKPHVSLSSAFYPPQTASTNASPRLQIATPVVPKAPTPIRQRPASFQSSHSSSPKTSLGPSGSSTTSPSMPSLTQNGVLPISGKSVPQTPLQQQATIGFSSTGPMPGSLSQPPGLLGMPGMAGTNFPHNQGPILPPIMQRGQMHDPLMHPPPQPHPHPLQFNQNQFRNFAGQTELPFPPGINGIRTVSHVRTTLDPPLSQSSIVSASAANIGPFMPRNTLSTHSHSRDTSASFSNFDIPSTPTQTQPIARPTPIHRPSSVAPNQQLENVSSTSNSDIDDISNHLGSSALLDDTDIPLSSNTNDSRHGSIAPGTPLFPRNGFGVPAMNPEAVNSNKLDQFSRPMPIGNGNAWGAQPMPFGAPPMSSPPTKWPQISGEAAHSIPSHIPNTLTDHLGHWSSVSHFGIIGTPKSQTSARARSIRILACRAYTKLQNAPSVCGKKGFQSAEAMLHEMELMKPNEFPILLKELLESCELEGNTQNGGGAFNSESFDGSFWLKYELVKFDGRKISTSTRDASGEIGSPVTSPFMPTFGGARLSQQPGVMSPTGF